VFQSHNGAIAATTNAYYRPTLRLFQSHNGAIAAALKRPDGLQSLFGFNPTMVRLLLDIAQEIYQLKPGFNPTMVRLLRKRLGRACFRHRLFQSHNGAIAARLRIDEVVIGLMFQSHNGAIAARKGERLGGQ